MFEMLRTLHQDEDGLTTVEYALLVAILLAGLVLTWRDFGCKVRWAISRSSNAFDTASGSGP